MRLLIFTDLDGTLLDHYSYSFAPALPSLTEIRRRGYPLILVSSKTRTELLKLREELQLEFPFICENGAAVHWQENNRWQCQAFSPPRETIDVVLQELRRTCDYCFTAFMDCTSEQIADLTDLPLEKARLASAREYTEPLLWQDSPEKLHRFLQQLRERGLQGIQGGRFLSIMGEFSKASAMKWLMQRYQSHAPTLTVALGDSPNDEAMLQTVDIAVVIQSDRSVQLEVNQPKWVIRTTQPGPAGWQDAMERILKTDLHALYSNNNS